MRPRTADTREVTSGGQAGEVPSPEVSKQFFLASSLSAPADPSLLAPATPGQRFVAQLYRDLLGREPDLLGLLGWSTWLDQGASREQVALGIEGSPEYLGGQVGALYLRLLHRPPDPAAGGFVNLLLAGGTLGQVAALIAGSPEYFQARGGGTADGFLGALYQDALGRPADPVGLADALQGLAAGMTPAQVADAVFHSAEYDADVVGGFYLRFLRRPADPGGLQEAVAGLLGGRRTEDALAVILGSDEYLALV
jgi:hypothetical protein